MNLTAFEKHGKWLLLAVTMIVYMRSLAGGFVWDDVTFFVENDILTKLKPWNLGTIIFDPISYWEGTLPLSDFLFVLEHFLFGKYTPAYHMVSLLLYLGVALAAWRFVENVYRAFSGPDGATRNKPEAGLSVLLVMSLFLLHPVHVEAVAYISGQKDLLSSLFALLTVNLLWRVMEQGWQKNLGRLVAGVVCYYLAILAKGQAVFIGLFIPLLYLLVRREFGGNVTRVFTAWGLINVPVVLWVLKAISATSITGQAGLSLLPAILRGIRILGAHLVLVFKPFPLNFGYPFDVTWSWDLNFTVGLLFLVVLVAVLIINRRSVVAVGLLLFIIYFFPIMQIVVEIDNAMIFDRYLFLPLLGLCLAVERLLAVVAVRSPGMLKAIGVTAIAILLTLAALTINYIPKFSTDLASIAHAYKHFPGWGRAAFDYQTVLIKEGFLDEAEELNSSEPTFAKPVWVRDYFSGQIALARGDVEQAISHLTRASRVIHRDGYFPFTGVYLAMAYMQKGQYDKAEMYLQDVIRASISNPIDKYRANRLLEELSAIRNEKAMR